MAKLAAHNSLILVDGLLASGFLNSWENTVNQEVITVTGFMEGGPRRVVGAYDYSFPLSGFFDGDDGAVDGIIHAAQDDDDHLITVIPAGVAGAIGYSGVGKLEGRPITGALAGAVMLNHTWQGASGLTRATLIHAANVTGTGSGTIYDLGATTDETFAVAVHVVGGTFSSITIRVQESEDDDGDPDAFADISGVTTTLSTAGAALLTTSSATERYKRVSIQAFSGTNASVYVAAGLVAGT